MSCRRRRMRHIPLFVKTSFFDFQKQLRNCSILTGYDPDGGAATSIMSGAEIFSPAEHIGKVKRRMRCR